MVPAAFTAAFVAALILFGVVARAEIPPQNLKIAFLGDQGLGAASEAVLTLVKQEGAEALVHLGDFDYETNPAAWEGQTNRILGPDFPQFAVVGNHDVGNWDGAGGYRSYVEARMERLGINLVGKAGVQCAFRYRGLFFILTAPGLMGEGHPEFIRAQLQKDTSIWRISGWHVNQGSLQVGGKGDEAGWGVYEESRLGGAIIATAHEHSYSRTHLLSSMRSQVVASRSGPLRLRRGRTFAFVSGLGGSEIRPQLRYGNWWASIYTSTQGAIPGALFANFHVDGDPRKAFFYFMNVERTVIDSFEVFSDIHLPIHHEIPYQPTGPRTFQLDPGALGFGQDGHIRVQDFTGRTVAHYGDLRKPVFIGLDGMGLVLLRVEDKNRRLLRKIVLMP